MRTMMRSFWQAWSSVWSGELGADAAPSAGGSPSADPGGGAARFLRRGAVTAGRAFFLATFDVADREADSARISWSFLIECQPAIPLSRASWASRLLLHSFPVYRQSYGATPTPPALPGRPPARDECN